MNKKIPIVIPSYEPDERLIAFLKDLVKAGLKNIIVVNDGSGDEYNDIFANAKKIIKPAGGVVLDHEVNKGKGRALKTAFSYALDNFSDMIGVVTADSDGQHTVSCVKSVINGLKKHKQSLVVGVRDFNAEGIPWKSRFGNKLTMKVLAYVSGIKVSDTQTGLRGIPSKFMKELLSVKGERFEFETKMLLETSGKYHIVEVPIKTIYDSAENHQTHFNPIVDSIKIYKILGAKFLMFIFASLSSSFLDLSIFALACHFLKDKEIGRYILIATIIARVISATYNYAINYTKVFKSEESVSKSAAKYAALCVVQMLCSALLVSLAAKAISACPEVIIKMLIDTFLFFISYTIQRKFVFSKTKQSE